MNLPKPPKVNHSFGLMRLKLKVAMLKNPALKAIAFQTQSTEPKKGNQR